MERPLVVKLLASTENPMYIIGMAARTCYADLDFEDLDVEVKDDPEKIKKLILEITRNGHTSVLEHVSFTFYIDGISRSCSHQLVRHRLASYSQRSQRYIEENDFGFVIPDEVVESYNGNILVRDVFNGLQEAYTDLIELGIKPEHARCILPNAAATTLVMTINARSLMNFFKLRLCERAQTEIRDLAKEMYALVEAKIPELAYQMLPECRHGAPCPQGNFSCPFNRRD